MKFSCTQENLNQGLSVVSHIASKNVNLPILNNILVKAGDGLITFLTTNLEIGVTCNVRGRVEEPGDFTVPARVLTDYIGLLPKEKVDFELKDNSYLEVKSEGHETKIKGEAASEFPLMPQVERHDPYLVKATDFLIGLQQVAFATAISESRPEISGVLMNFLPEEKKLIIAATDSYRLAEKKLNLSQASGESKRIIVPVRTLQEMQRILSSTSRDKNLDGENLENIEIYLSDNQILFVYDSIEVISRVVSGQYPDYASIIPDHYQTQVVVATEDLVRAVKSASLFVKSGINDVSLKFSPTGGITTSAINSQVGENTSAIEASVSGGANEVVLNYRYLLDGLNALDSNEAVLEIIDNNTPIICKPALLSADDSAERDYLYLIMPIKQ